MQTLGPYFYIQSLTKIFKSFQVFGFIRILTATIDNQLLMKFAQGRFSQRTVLFELQVTGFEQSTIKAVHFLRNKKFSAGFDVHFKVVEGYFSVKCFGANKKRHP